MKRRSLIAEVVKGTYRAVLRQLYGPAQTARHNARAAKSLLLIRTDEIGDFVLFTPALKYISRTFPDHRITLVVNEQAYDLALACPYLDEVIPCNVRSYRRSLLYRFALLQELRKRAFRIAVHPVYSRTPEGDELLYCSGAAERIGFDGNHDHLSRTLKARNNHCYTQLIRAGDHVLLEIDRNRTFAEQLIREKIDPKDFLPQVWVTKTDRAEAQSLLAAAGVDVARDLLVALVPGALSRVKAWPSGHFALLADKIAAAYEAKIVICGSASEEPLASAIAAQMEFPAVNLAGRTRLRQLAALLESCGILVANDTGPLHIAVAMGTPTLCIMGGGHFERFYPYGDLNKHRAVFRKMDCFNCHWECIYETTRCIQEINVADVWQATGRLLEEMVVPSRLARKSSEREVSATL